MNVRCQQKWVESKCIYLWLNVSYLCLPHLWALWVALTSHPRLIVVQEMGVAFNFKSCGVTWCLNAVRSVPPKKIIWAMEKEQETPWVLAAFLATLSSCVILKLWREGCADAAKTAQVLPFFSLICKAACVPVAFEFVPALHMRMQCKCVC